MLKKPLLVGATLLVLFSVLLAGCTGLVQSQGPGNAGLMIQIEELVIGLLVVAAVVSLVTQRLRIPYTVGLVLVGLALALVGRWSAFTVMPEIILAMLVPPLVFEAAFHLNFSDLRRDLPLIAWLTIPGVILTVLFIGGLVSWAAGLSLPTALVFGALIAATDPVAVVGLFRQMGVPHRLQVLLEGESLLNDGTAIVLFNLVVAVSLTGKFNLAGSAVQFVVVAGGGILVGAVAGIIVSQVIGRIDNHLIETSLTTILAYGAYLAAEYLLGVSGVLAVVAAGVAAGHLGPRGMSPTTRIVVANFWEYAAFLANSFVFLIIGLQMDLTLLARNAGSIGWGILAALAARAVMVFGLSSFGKNISWRWRSVMVWGGLRGAISLALALSLPSDLPDRGELQAMAFGVVLFTLLVEGLSMKALVRRLGLVQADPDKVDYEKNHARAIGVQAAQTHLARLKQDGLISAYTWRRLKPALENYSAELAQAIQAALEGDSRLHTEELMDAWREALRTQRSTLYSLFRNQIITEEVFDELVVEIDASLEEPQKSWQDFTARIDGPSEVDETQED
jgi:monovalent cation:H+ antiporter, CPA1 family